MRKTSNIESGVRRNIAPITRSTRSKSRSASGAEAGRKSCRIFGAGFARFYGISREQYEGLLAKQGGVCGICRKPPARAAVRRSFPRHRQGARAALPQVQHRARLL